MAAAAAAAAQEAKAARAAAAALEAPVEPSASAGIKYAQLLTCRNLGSAALMRLFFGQDRPSTFIPTTAVMVSAHTE